jgi:hypothetical protein
MKGTLEGDHHSATVTVCWRAFLGNLYCALDGLRPAVGEEAPRELARGKANELLGEQRRDIVVVIVGDVHIHSGLTPDGLHHLRVGMSYVGDRDAREEVGVTPA